MSRDVNVNDRKAERKAESSQPSLASRALIPHLRSPAVLKTEPLRDDELF